MNEIQNYAKLLNKRQAFFNAKKPFPVELQNEINKAETTAKRVFSSEQLYYVNRQVEQLRTDYISDDVELAKAQDFQIERVRQNKAFEKTTAGMSSDGKPVSASELATSLNNNGKFTRKAKPQFDELAHERLCQRKFKCSLNEFYERHDQIQSAEQKDPRVAEILRDKWDITKAMQSDYEKNGFKVAWAQNEAKTHPQEDTEVFVANEIKADIMDAMTSEDHQMNVYDEPISSKLLNQDSLAGTIANSFHQHEEQQVHEAAGIDYEIDVDEESGEIRGHSNG